MRIVELSESCVRKLDSSNLSIVIRVCHLLLIETNCQIAAAFESDVLRLARLCDLLHKC